MVSILIHCSNKSEKVSILHCTDVVEFRRVFGVRHDQPELPHFQEATGERWGQAAHLHEVGFGTGCEVGREEGAHRGEGLGAPGGLKGGPLLILALHLQ